MPDSLDRVAVLNGKLESLHDEVHEEVKEDIEKVEDDLTQIKFSLFFIAGLAIGDLFGLQAFMQSIL